MFKKKILYILEKVTKSNLPELEFLDETTELYDLGITSIEFIEMIVEIEKTFNIEIRDSDLIIEHFKTIGDLFNIVEGYIRNSKNIIYKKCIILDCDDVLWKGVAGEEKIVIDDDVVNFQKLLKSFFNKGIILCLCTKNNITNIKSAFSTPEMMISFDNIVTYRANDCDKVTNILEISNELNLTTDSFIFLDDSQYELEYVKNLLPTVSCVLVNYNNLEFIADLKNFFDQNSLSDFDRSKLYKEQKEREKNKYNYTNITEYNKFLNTKYICEIATLESIPRLVELSQRTNQFNLSNVHYTKEELFKIIDNPNYIIIYLSASDMYGDLGIIGFSVLNRCTNTIEAFSISCRVFDRGFEEILINEVKNLSEQKLFGVYVDNKKNTKFSNFYEANGIIKI